MDAVIAAALDMCEERTVKIRISRIKRTKKRQEVLMKKLNIKVGISDFAEIRDSGCYYIDKSGLISDLLQNNTAKVTLITRPRRFGKHWQ